MKSKLPILFALAVAVVALLAIRSYIKRMEQQTQAQLKGSPVVAASVDIPEGAELAMSMISPLEVPDKFIPAQAIQGSKEVKLVLGRKTRVPLKAGQIILWSDFQEERRGGLSSFIPENEGAFTVSIARGIKPGLIQVSDHVDILGSFSVPKPASQQAAAVSAWRQSSDVVNVVLLQNVTVLAVGDTFGGATRTENSTGGDLTLSLTLPEAQLLMFASQHGELGALLRRDGASKVKPRAELPRVTFETLEGIIGDLEDKRLYRNVEVQKGTQTDQVPVHAAPDTKGDKP